MVNASVHAEGKWVMCDDPCQCHRKLVRCHWIHVSGCVHTHCVWKIKWWDTLRYMCHGLYLCHCVYTDGDTSLDICFGLSVSLVSMQKVRYPLVYVPWLCQCHRRWVRHLWICVVVCVFALECVQKVKHPWLYVSRSVSVPWCVSVQKMKHPWLYVSLCLCHGSWSVSWIIIYDKVCLCLHKGIQAWYRLACVCVCGRRGGVFVGVSCVCVWANGYVCICHSCDRNNILCASKDKKSWSHRRLVRHPCVYVSWSVCVHQVSVYPGVC